MLAQVAALAAVLLVVVAPAASGAGTPSPGGSGGSSSTPAGATGLPERAPVVLTPTAVAGSSAPVPSPTASPLRCVRHCAALPRRHDRRGRRPATGQVLLDTSDGRTGTPASSLKVLTAVTALVALGPGARLRTRVLRSGGTVVLVGAGDASLTRNPSRLGGEPTVSITTLADATAKALGSAKVAVRYDDSLFTGPRLAPGWSSGLLATGEIAPVTALSVDKGRTSPGGLEVVDDPSLRAAEEFAAALERRGITVTGAPRRGTAPAGATEIAGGDSPPIAVLVEQTLTESDDDMAEALAHLAGGKLGGSASFAGGAAATAKVLAALGVTTTGMELSDGSGLSRRDQVSPLTLAGTLAAVASARLPDALPSAAPSGGGVATWPVSPGLPVAGFTGTLAERFDASSVASARGLVRAKTGTLTGCRHSPAWCATRTAGCSPTRSSPPRCPSSRRPRPRSTGPPPSWPAGAAVDVCRPWPFGRGLAVRRDEGRRPADRRSVAAEAVDCRVGRPLPSGRWSFRRCEHVLMGAAGHGRRGVCLPVAAALALPGSLGVGLVLAPPAFAAEPTITLAKQGPSQILVGTRAPTRSPPPTPPGPTRSRSTTPPSATCWLPDSSTKVPRRRRVRAPRRSSPARASRRWSTCSARR
jgi:D-alanyl-D-alanine carboxypeptidase/D-alanyl-D-alanine-endopeptidase (penicillin-binding protein 4)